MTFKIVPETATREAMLRAGQIDICYKPSPANVAALKADPTSRWRCPSTRGPFHGPQLSKRGHKKQAGSPSLQLRCGQERYVKKILFDTAVKMEGPASPILFGYHKMEKQWDYNPEKPNSS